MRAEVVGAMVNSVFLASLCLTIGIEAIKRFIAVQEIEKVDLLLYVASLGLLINLIGLAIFGHGHSHGHSHGTDVKVTNNQQSNSNNQPTIIQLSLETTNNQLFL